MARLHPVVSVALAAGAVLSLPVVPALRRLARRVLPDGLVWALESIAATVLGALALLFLAACTRQSFLYFQF